MKINRTLCCQRESDMRALWWVPDIRQIDDSRCGRTVFMHVFGLARVLQREWSLTTLAIKLAKCSKKKIYKSLHHRVLNSVNELWFRMKTYDLMHKDSYAGPYFTFIGIKTAPPTTNCFYDKKKNGRIRCKVTEREGWEVEEEEEEDKRE